MTFQELAGLEIEVPDDGPLVEALRRTGPMNLPWAREVMARRGVDALVLGDPLNIFHVTGHTPFVGRARPGAPPSMFVIVTRNPDVAPALVVARFYYYYTFVDGNFGQDRPLYVWGDAREVRGGGFYPDRGEAPLSALEIRRATGLETAVQDHALGDGMTKTLAHALRDLGVADGHLCFDYPSIPAWMDFEGVGARWEPADDIVRHIRLVKSPLEIALMRHASAVNLASAHAAMATARDGMSHRDFRRRFFAELAARGGQGVTLTIDRDSNELSDHRLVDGQTLMIDAVSRYRNYHGDYGRTLFMGEPTAPMQRAVAAVSAGWQAIREVLKPGLKFSEISAIGREAVKKSGYDFTISFGPHSVGLLHTDEPIAWTNGLPGKADLRLQENMILSVDCPVLETGFGGSAHLEDLSLITADGAVPIHPVTGAALVV